MKYILSISIALFFFSCAVHKEEGYTLYNHFPSDKTYNIMELVPEFNMGKIELSKVKRVLIEINALNVYWKDKALKTLIQCKEVEAISITYPGQYKEVGLSEEISSTLTQLPKLVVLGVGFDSLSTLPSYVKENPGIREIYYFGKYVERVENDIINSDGLKYVQLSFSTTNLACDFTKCKNLVYLMLQVNGDINAPNLDSLDQLKWVHIYNDELEELPDDFFAAENIGGLYLHLPKLKGINPNITRLKQLVTLTIENNELDYLPEFLVELKQLNTLSIKSYKLDHLPEFLGELTALKTLSITSAGKIKSLAPLVKLPSLKSLAIYGIDPILVIDDILAMPSLEFLYLSLPLLLDKDLSTLQRLKDTHIKRIIFSTSGCMIEKNGEIIELELDQETQKVLYDKLHKILPSKYFKH